MWDINTTPVSRQYRMKIYQSFRLWRYIHNQNNELTCLGGHFTKKTALFMWVTYNTYTQC